MKASEIPVGSGFVGSIWYSDWREHWKAGKSLPGELIGVSAIVPGAQRGDEYLKSLLKLHARHLHRDSSSQLSHSEAFWVCGVRESRSKKVYVFEWLSRSNETCLEMLHGILKGTRGATFNIESALAELENLEKREVPYL